MNPLPEPRNIKSPGQSPLRQQSAGLPLTYAQESLYLLQQLTRGEPVYNMPQAFRLRGHLDLNALSSALRWVVDRHEALRTTIQEKSGGPVQAVLSSDSFSLRLHDVTSQTLPELQAAVREPFDLASGPVFRADLFRVAEQDHVLLLNLHHIVGDMSSLGIIFSDLSRAYRSFLKHVSPETSENVVQISEYATNRRRLPATPETIEFWKRNLADHTADLELALDRFRPRYPTFKGAVYYFDLRDGLPAALRQLARKNRSSLYMVSLAALQILLHRYTGQEKFALATPFTDRDDPSFDQTVGYLINLLPIACHVQPDTSFKDLLSRVRVQCLDVFSHRRISFRQIVQELGVATGSPKPPLAKVVFQYFPEVAALQLENLQVEPVPVHSGTSKFDLSLSMAETGDRITTEIEYDTDIFEAGSIRRLARHFTAVLNAVVLDPEIPVSAIDLADDRERVQLQQWNATAVPYPRDATVHSLFQEQVEATPAKTALLFKDRQLSYRELDTRANLIARKLIDAGVKPGNFVGVCLDRSPELIATLLGILKAGAAFVPIEASYPKARLDYLFSDSDLQFLVTTSHYATVAPAGIKVVLVDEWTDAIVEFTSLCVPAEGPAYMMYTSGSTGQPKGVVIPHRAIVRLVRNNTFAKFGPEQTFLAFAPVSFDASTLEIWGALLNGGTLAIYPPQFESIEQFEAVLQQHQVTTLWLTAGLFNTIVDRKAEALRGVRQLLIGGDVLSVSHVQRAIAALPGTELTNGYGPTENTTFTCCYRIPKTLPPDRSVPIGSPISNTTVYILDDRMRQVAVGVPGNLYTGGDGLALGYWRKDELTAKSFLNNPFEAGGRLYNTGDRARYRDDGSIEFLGRRDSQVKIRGFRIEIEEVEESLREIRGIQDVAVVAHPDKSGNKSLVAYVVLQPGANLRSTDVRDEASKLLPSHACPSRILLLPELPLSPNGKVNRTALPEPNDTEGIDDRGNPTNSVEAKLVELWRQILEVSALGIDDNFFLHGGESLRATRAISQMNAVFNCRLALPCMFEAPTVRQMAQIVENARQSSAAEPLPSTPAMRFDSNVDVEKLSEQDVDALLAQLLDDPLRN